MDFQRPWFEINFSMWQMENELKQINGSVLGVQDNSSNDDHKSVDKASANIRSQNNGIESPRIRQMSSLQDLSMIPLSQVVILNSQAGKNQNQRKLLQSKRASLEKVEADQTCFHLPLVIQLNENREYNQSCKVKTEQDLAAYKSSRSSDLVAAKNTHRHDRAYDTSTMFASGAGRAILNSKGARIMSSGPFGGNQVQPICRPGEQAPSAVCLFPVVGSALCDRR